MCYQFRANLQKIIHSTKKIINFALKKFITLHKENE